MSKKLYKNLAAVGIYILSCEDIHAESINNNEFLQEDKLISPLFLQNISLERLMLSDEVNFSCGSGIDPNISCSGGIVNGGCTGGAANVGCTRD